MQTDCDALIVGAGLAGLVAACELADAPRALLPASDGAGELLA